MHGRAIKMFFHDNWRSTRYGWYSRVLHRLDHVGVDALVVQTDDFGGGQRSHDSRGAHIVLDQRRIDAGLGHCENLIDVCRAGLHLSAQLVGNLSPVLGSHFIHSRSDGCAGQCAQSRSNQGASSGVARLVADDRACSSACECAQACASVGVVGRSTTCECAENQRENNEGSSHGDNRAIGGGEKYGAGIVPGGRHAVKSGPLLILIGREGRKDERRSLLA